MTSHYSSSLPVDDLQIDYQFTFNLSKPEDRHYTQINFRNSPSKPDVDADFQITCSILAKINITVKIGEFRRWDTFIRSEKSEKN